MSDLQCAARLTLVTDGEVDPSTLRPAALYASAAAVSPADRPGARYDVLDGPLPEALETIADQHRGEDVLVLVTPEQLAELPGTAGRSAPVRVDIDADGWLLRS